MQQGIYKTAKEIDESTKKIDENTRNMIVRRSSQDDLDVF